MDLFWKAAAGVLLAVVLKLVLEKQSKDLGILLSIAVCCMVAGIAVSFLEPVLDFIHQLETYGNIQGDMLRVLLKAVGVGLVSEIIAMICLDAGHSSLGKVMSLLSSGVILWLSLPIFNGFLDLLKQILGEI